MTIVLIPRRIRIGAVSSALAISLGCGAENNPAAPSDATVPSATPAAIAGTVPPGNDTLPGVYKADVVMMRSGTATVTLRWPNGEYSLQLYVTSGPCADATSLVAGTCTVIGRTRPGTLPGVITSTVASGEPKVVWVLNTDPSPQSFTVGIDVR